MAKKKKSLYATIKGKAHKYISKTLTKLFATTKPGDKDYQAIMKRKKQALKDASDLKKK